jgi:fructose-1,6-bisphosphatase/sedoheptulose 1,7-bisphosphatase-like protein
MRERLNQMDFSAAIAIGEGKKDASFGLFEGEFVGKSQNDLLDFSKSQIEYSIAVDPIEGTTPTAKGGYEAMSVIAMAKYGCLFRTEEHYMYKFAVGREAMNKNEYLDLSIPLESTVPMLAHALGKPINRVTVCLLERSRHDSLVMVLRKIGCRIKFIQDCDVTACIATCVPDSGIDMYVGVGGAPEAVIAAAAIKCMGGYFQAALADKDGKRIDDKVMEIEDLAKGEVMFAATGITDGQLLQGVQFSSRGPITNSIAMRSGSGTIRRITTEHGN